MTSKKDSRNIHVEMDFKQSPERIWRALTDAGDVVRWFCSRATVEPGEGGRIRWDWDAEGCAFDSEILVWQPGTRLKLMETVEKNGVARPLVMDFQLTTHAGGTTLRLVHSGFGRDSDWDNEYHGVARGWPYELGQMRHYLDHYDGQDRHFAMIFQPTTLSERTVLQRVLQCLGAPVDTLSRPVGSGVTCQSEDGLAYRGTIFSNNPPWEFAFFTESPAPGVVRIHAEGGAAFLTYAVWGERHPSVSHFHQYWSQQLPLRLFPEAEKSRPEQASTRMGSR